MIRLLCSAALAFLAFVAVPLSADAATAIGKVVSAIGGPTASGPGGDRTLTSGAAVYEDDKIVVRNGNAQILLRDDTRLVIGPGSTMVLDRFIMKGGNKAQKVSLKALRGTFRFITGRSNKQAYEITTSSATIGIRGTGFDYWVKGQTGVAVLKGLVRLCPLKSKRDDDCQELRDTCEVGRADTSSSARFTAQNAARNIRNNLPYLINQSALRQAFRLPTGKCDRVLASLKLDSDQSGELPSAGTPEPPGPPDNPDRPDRPTDPGPGCDGQCVD